jgi:hypothetical protein
MKFSPIDLSDIRTYPVRDRKSLVRESDFGRPWKKGDHFNRFIDRLPDILAAKDLKEVIAAITLAHQNRRTIVMGMGAHVIKVGLNPVIIDLMERGIINGLAINGAGIIHDLELAMTGSTSEDVSASLDSGMFGMARETCEFLSEAIRFAGKEKTGLGYAVGQKISRENLPFSEKSLLAAGYRLDIPVTVHIAIGTDILHMHPGFDAAAAGEASHCDFRLFANVISSLEEGVYLNVGSAVILPEVFLKAVSLIRNLGYRLETFTTVNMDFIRQYRPLTNVVNRPTQTGGKGFNLVGHHEIMLPLIAAGVIETAGC